ncbi:molybdenum cofactor guanylyltransferase [Runella rosea]|uniref:Probable molybdenum cofactor guanylyltransferase n=1 Tax=Runella rosea TaxID=2259595 RepID=A0A344TMB7_9BACT|nr:NTP transferase domain-containing protein [Runella rosea]AXE19788.1 molybdenum cofactor guanylyltransferase [Runella rosea]
MNALILAGGRSTRMGTDKSLLTYHHQPQWRYLYELLTPYCSTVFISCRADQKDNFDSFPCLIDTREIGPLGGILSAFEHSPNEAWLVMACDMPLVAPETIAFLVNHRQSNQIATAFQHPETLFPEPLLTIWEPQSYQSIQAQFQQNRFSPLQILKKANVHLIPCPTPRWLQNINTPEDFKNTTGQ